MNEHSFTILESGQRLDAFLSENFPDRSRSFLQDLIKNEYVTVNGITTTKAGLKLKKDSTVAFSFPEEPKPWHLAPRDDIKLEILYEDSDTLVINKPLGISVHPGQDMESKERSIAHAVLAVPGINLSIKNTVRPGIVHRLDKWTSGALLIAKNDRAIEYYSSEFKNRTVTKEYVALVFGHVEHSHGVIDAPIARSLHDRKKMAIIHGGKMANTEYFVLQYFQNYTLLRVLLHTGRTHQIRVHLTSIGHPLVGDPTYGARTNPFPKVLQGQFLHAELLEFTTLEGKKVTIHAPLSTPYQHLVDSLE